MHEVLDVISIIMKGKEMRGEGRERQGKEGKGREGKGPCLMSSLYSPGVEVYVEWV
jgi:hypothetical protein